MLTNDEIRQILKDALSCFNELLANARQPEYEGIATATFNTQGHTCNLVVTSERRMFVWVGEGGTEINATVDQQEEFKHELRLVPYVSITNVAIETPELFGAPHLTFTVA